MKTLKKTLINLILVSGVILAFAQCTKDSTTDDTLSLDDTKSIIEEITSMDTTVGGCDSIALLGIPGTCSGNLFSYINTLPVEPLSASEINSLTTMREEELLAQDVYVMLYSIYDVPVFNNISKAETQHATAVQTLLLKYSLPDPALNHVAGNYVNPGLQALYTSLVAQGSTSLSAALIVGATIEDLDINDLHNHSLIDADNLDVLFVFNNLEKGSRNHLRSFYRLLTATGGTYTPQFISLEYFNDIISTPHETGLAGTN
jgi:hypothetical protein